MVWAKPTRSRHGPSRPNAGIRTISASGLTAATVSQSIPRLVMTRGEKFSITTSQEPSSRRASASPSAVPSSSVTSRLFSLTARKMDPVSHQWSTVGGLAPANRMPSGRLSPSTFTTSAPSEPSTRLPAGPAQKAVKSMTRMSASGWATVPVTAGA